MTITRKDIERAAAWITERPVITAVDQSRLASVLAAYAAHVTAEKDAEIKDLKDGAQKEDDRTYEIGVRDGYEKAVQAIDSLTGGDGEYRCVVGVDIEGHCPDAASMIKKITERFMEKDAEIERLKGSMCDTSPEDPMCKLEHEFARKAAELREIYEKEIAKKDAEIERLRNDITFAEARASAAAQMLEMGINLVKENPGGVPRYTITPGAALNMWVGIARAVVEIPEAR